MHMSVIIVSVPAHVCFSERINKVVKNKVISKFVILDFSER